MTLLDDRSYLFFQQDPGQGRAGQMYMVLGALMVERRSLELEGGLKQQCSCQPAEMAIDVGARALLRFC
ncbi:hypothetical protein Dimus_033191 [Dionaea muscipula]